MKPPPTGSFWRRHGPVLVILVLYVLLGSLYSVIDPVFEASDELNHYPFVQHLAQGQGLPVQRAGTQTLWGQEGSQPPLYYALGAALTGWIDSRDLPDLLYLNPHANRGVPGAHDNKNMVVHTARETFPWHGATLAVHLIRLFSVLLGAGTVLCTYRLALDLFPNQPYLALAAAAVNAFIPMFLFISASVNNDNLVITLSALALVLIVRLLLGPGPKRRWPYLAGLGLVLGLACLAKLSALGLLPLAALALLWVRLSEGSDAQPEAGKRGVWSRLGGWVVDCLWVFGPVLAVAGWWYLRNWQLYGDPTGLSMMLAVAGHRQAVPGLLELLDEFEGFRINFWGLFGGVNVLMRPVQVYRLLDLLTLLALAGLVIGFIRARRRHARVPWVPLLFLVLWTAIEFVALVRWTLSTAASQGRLMFPALPALCLFFVLGLAAWLPTPWRRVGLVAVAGYLFVVAATAPFLAIQPAYPRPDWIAASEIPASAQRVDLRYGDALHLLAYEIDESSVRPGGALGVTLYWEALRPITDDLSLSLVLLASPQQRVGQLDTYPAGGALATSQWSPGRILRDHYLLDVNGDALGPTPAWMVPGVYQLATLKPLPVTDAQGKPVAFPAVARARLEASPPTLLPSERTEANLNGQALLIGYDLPEKRLQPGQSLPLDLYWQVTAKPDRNYKVFLHLVGDDDKLGGQGDALPLGGFYPTSQWQPGDILKDRYLVQVSPELTPGTYKLLAGLYDPTTGERVSILDSQGRPAAQEIWVTTLRYP